MPRTRLVPLSAESLGRWGCRHTYRWVADVWCSWVKAGRRAGTAVQIAERQRGRDKVLGHLGSARNDAELAALLEAARRNSYAG